MKPYNKRSLIGTARITYNEEGEPIAARFDPGALNVDIKELSGLLLTPPVDSAAKAVSTAHAVIAAWFLKVENMETADREFNRIASEVITCDTWSNGNPIFCEVAFYFETTEDK